MEIKVIGDIIECVQSNEKKSKKDILSNLVIFCYVTTVLLYIFGVKVFPFLVIILFIIYINHYLLRKYEFITEKLVIKSNGLELSHYIKNKKIRKQEILYDNLKEITYQDIFWKKYRKGWSIKNTANAQRAILLITENEQYFFGYQLNIFEAKEIIRLVKKNTIIILIKVFKFPMMYKLDLE